MYKIIGIYRGNKEVLEEQVKTKQEANFLVQEYQMSFGNEWIIYKN